MCTAAATRAQAVWTTCHEGRPTLSELGLQKANPKSSSAFASTFRTLTQPSPAAHTSVSAGTCYACSSLRRPATLPCHPPPPPPPPPPPLIYYKHHCHQLCLSCAFNRKCSVPTCNPECRCTAMPTASQSIPAASQEPAQSWSASHASK